MGSDKPRLNGSLPFLFCAVFALITAVIAQAFYINWLVVQQKQQDSRISKLEANQEHFFPRNEDKNLPETHDEDNSQAVPLQVFGKPHARIVVENKVARAQKLKGNLKFLDSEHEPAGKKENPKVKELLENWKIENGDLLTEKGDEKHEHEITKRSLTRQEKRFARWKKILFKQKVIQGKKGDKGEKGDRGPTGPIGNTGLKGDKGDKGDAGRSVASELIHLIGTGGIFDMTGAVNRGTTFNRWRVESKVGKVRHDYEEGRIHIAVPGYYYVYCQIHYHAKLFFNQHKIQKNKKKTLMLGYDTFNGTLTGSRRHSSTNYIGGIFKLVRGDTVYVSGQPTTYFFSRRSNYFGLYLIHELPQPEA